MFNTLFTRGTARLLAATTISAACALHAHAASGPCGSTALDQSASRAITLSPRTRSVNVNDGDTITFVQGGQHFTWHFSIHPGNRPFNLAAIAPPHSVPDSIVVYVASDPLYR